jgi:Ca-activated chloride channel family protein
VTRPFQLRIQLAVTLLFAVGITGALVIAKPPPLRTCQRIVIASSAEKFGMLRDFAASYNRTAGSAANPCVTVAVEQVNSGDAELALEQGWRGQSTERPDVWAPASSAWVNLLRSNDPSALPLSAAPSLFKSPLVIGMPEPMADALGYPGKPVGWKDIFTLVNDPRGWGAIGHAGWGQFKLGKTNPTVSTSGLHALIGTYFAAPGTGLTVDRVNSAPVHDFVAGVEAGVVHYGETAADFLGNLRDASDQAQDAGLMYVSAVALEEQELVDYNAGFIGGQDQGGAPRVSLVPIYPSEGTPVADHPYVILNSARKSAAESFFNYLALPAQQVMIDKHGFRTAGSVDRGEVGASLSQQPFIKISQPALVLQPPEGAVLKAMLSAWQGLRKRARVLILVDAAATPALLKQATARLADAVSRFNRIDDAGVWVFPAPANYATPNIESVAVGPVSGGLSTALKGIAHTGDRSDVARSLRAAVDWMSASFDPGAIDAVLLVEMSPGDRTTDDQQLEQYLSNQPSDHFVRVFTIGPEGPLSQRLRDYALAGRGVAYQPGSASHLLNDVISNF